jgi:nitronate monooxygenase
MMRTWLTEHFGLSVPVVSAPMATASGGALAGAVSAAGALGMIGYAAGPPDELAAEIDLAVASGRPFGVGMLAWLLPRYESLLDVVLDHGVALVSLSYGDYARYIDRIHAAGALVATQVGTVADAREAADAGVDIIVARGGEGGGHGRDTVATLPLLQAVLDEVDRPVLAAGGVATARGLAAVLAAGAAGAWVGTPFLACDESLYDEAAKSAVLTADLDGTIYTTVYDIGRQVPWPAQFGGRALRSGYADKWHGREEELRADPTPPDTPTVWAGQSVGFVRNRRPAGDVVAELAGAEQLLRAAAATLSSAPHA